MNEAESVAPADSSRSIGSARSGEAFDGILFLSFGGPEKREDVIPFLENVTRGRGVPRERLDEVAEHYMHFDGYSPINRLNLEMIDGLRAALDRAGVDLPIFFGNRNWHPMAADTLADAYRLGHRRLLVFATSAWGGYSGCRQYHEDIEKAIADLAAGIPASTADPVLLRRLPQFWHEPAFRDSGARAVRRAAAALSEKKPGAGESARLVFTAHSVPDAADEAAGPPGDGGGLYSRQVRAASAAVADALGVDDFDVVWQSRSGPPQVPWLEPDICDHLESLAAQGVADVIVYPIGFISDHLEVIWDLDNEAAEVATEHGLGYARADTVGTDPEFVEMIADLVIRHADGGGDLDALGCRDNGTLCALGCCEPARRPRR